MESENYKIKYLKYKKKYLNLKEQHGGILYASGSYIFFFNSSILQDVTIFLNNLENRGVAGIPKPDFDKITNEIAKNGGGWYYYKGVSGPSSEIKKIESSLSVIKKTAKSAASSTGKAIASTGSAIVNKVKEVKASMDEKSRLALCEKCRKANCDLVGGFSENDNDQNFNGGSQSSFKIDTDLLASIKKSKNLTEDDILDGLKSLLETNGIEVNRAIVCRITTGANPMDPKKIHLYKTW
jgi:hypothetical protein